VPVIVGAAASLSWQPATGGGTAALAVRLPDGTTAPAPAVTESSGAFSATLPTSQPGRHLLTWTRGGEVFVDVLDVWPVDPRYLVSLKEAGAQVGSLPRADLDLLPLYVATATWVIEHLVGPVLPEPRTAHGVTGREAVVLPAIGVSVESVTAGGVLLDSGAYTVDEAAGIVRVHRARGPLVVTYRAGFDVLPANLRLAALELVRHLWSSSRQTGRPGAVDAAADTVATPFGFAIPRRVVELCSLTPSAPGFA